MGPNGSANAEQRDAGEEQPERDAEAVAARWLGGRIDREIGHGSEQFSELSEQALTEGEIAGLENAGSSASVRMQGI